MINRETYLAFERLAYSVRTGKPAFEKVFGSPRFDWLSQYPEQAVLFQQAMVAPSQGSNEAVAEAYDFGAFTRVVDVGGGHGQLLSAILARNPHLRGVLFDLPSGLAAAHDGAGGPLPRTEFVAGDFFERVPAGDIYVIKKVIHESAASAPPTNYDIAPPTTAASDEATSLHGLTDAVSAEPEAAAGLRRSAQNRRFSRLPSGNRLQSARPYQSSTSGRAFFDHGEPGRTSSGSD